MGRRLNDLLTPRFVVVGYYSYYHTGCCHSRMMENGITKGYDFGLVLFDVEGSEGQPDMQYIFQ